MIEVSLLFNGVASDAFTLAWRNHPAGVAVITANPVSGPVVLMATSFVSVSVEPPIVIFSLSALWSATARIRVAETIGVYLLADKDAHIARLCATSGVDCVADAMMWSSLTTGALLTRGVESWPRCRVVDRMKARG